MDDFAMDAALLLLGMAIGGAVASIGTLIWIAVTGRRGVSDGEVGQ